MREALPQVQLLTCADRKQMCVDTLDRWAHMDWPVAPRVHFDFAKENETTEWGTSARAKRLTDAFAAMLREALSESERDDHWFLFLEDDLDFRPRIAAHVSAWDALNDR